ncbi:MAG: carboxypeptidase-like regulatory domain-containing protein [Acidobacteriota bacterium]
MAYRRVIAGWVLAGALAAPAFAGEGGDQRRRGNGEQTARQAPQGDRRGAERAVPRSSAPPRQYDSRREYQTERREVRPYVERRQIQRPYYQGPSYANRGYGRRTVIVPRIIRPSIVTIAPYRPYVYRPSYGIGYYGAGGAYPYGYTPRGYYNPVPGRYYGGVRITEAPRDGQVFADGYYVGTVNDFDGVFQHVNLEAGRHRIEIDAPGFQPVAFDVMVQPGRTMTLRADMYPY